MWKKIWAFVNSIWGVKFMNLIVHLKIQWLETSNLYKQRCSNGYGELVSQIIFKFEQSHFLIPLEIVLYYYPIIFYFID